MTFSVENEKLFNTKSVSTCLFKLAWGPNFNSKKQFEILGQNLSKTNIFNQNEKKWTSPLNSAYSN